MANFPETQADFVAIKVGDVNNTHFDDLAPGKPAAKAGEFVIEYPAFNAKPGEFITLPVTYRGTEKLAAFQLGLSFDPQRLELVGPAAGELVGMNADCFGFTEINNGKIRVVWLAMEPENYLVEGQTLFSLTFKVLLGEKSKTPLLQTDNTVLENLGFRTDGATYGLTAEPSSLPGERSPATVASDTGIEVACLPNPTAGTATLRLETRFEKQVAVSIYSAFGVRKFYKELELPARVTELNITEANNWPAGVYVWKVKAGKNKSQGTFIMQ